MTKDTDRMKRDYDMIHGTDSFATDDGMLRHAHETIKPAHPVRRHEVASESTDEVMGVAPRANRTTPRLSVNEKQTLLRAADKLEANSDFFTAGKLRIIANKSSEAAPVAVGDALADAQIEAFATEARQHEAMEFLGRTKVASHDNVVRAIRRALRAAGNK